MLAVVFALDDTLTPAEDAHRVLAELSALAVPILGLSAEPPGAARARAAALGFPFDVISAPHDERGAPTPAAVAALAARTGLPASCLWYLARGDAARADAVTAAGAHGVALERVEEALDVLREPYTRAALNLRYMMRTVTQL